MATKKIRFPFFLGVFFNLADVVGSWMKNEMTQFMGRTEYATLHRNPFPDIYNNGRPSVRLPNRQTKEAFGSQRQRQHLDAGTFQQAANIPDGFRRFEPKASSALLRRFHRGSGGKNSTCGMKGIFLPLI